MKFEKCKFVWSDWIPVPYGYRKYIVSNPRCGIGIEDIGNYFEIFFSNSDSDERNIIDYLNDYNNKYGKYLFYNLDEAKSHVDNILLSKALKLFIFE